MVNVSKETSLNFMNGGFKITVVGTGYVGMSMAVLLSQHNEVTALDIDKERVDVINRGKSTVVDPDIEKFLIEKELSLDATLNKSEAYEGADFIIVATSTDYDPESNYFNMFSRRHHDAILHNQNALIIIKSTVPVGFTKYLKEKFSTDRIIFSPEFLREGKALYDNLNPSCIIIGGDSLGIDLPQF